MSRGKLDVELKVGFFVSLGIGLIMLAVILLGGTETFFSRNANYFARFSEVQGLIKGAKVVLNGIRVGTVQNMQLDRSTKDIRVTFSVSDDHKDWITHSATVEIATQGVLGDKFISITGGNPADTPIVPGGELATAPSSDIGTFFSSSEELLASLKSIAINLNTLLGTFISSKKSEVFFKSITDTAHNLADITGNLKQQVEQTRLAETTANMREASKNLNTILKKINNGTGTIGAFVNDPELYNDMRSLFGGVNRNRVMRNLIRKSVHDAEDK